MTRSRQQQAEDLYKKVVKRFPNVKRKEIKIFYSPFLAGTAGYSGLNVAETKKEPKILLGYFFFDRPKEDQEVIIAHEIGHHETMKDYSIPRLKRIYKWNSMYNDMIIPYSRPHWEQRLGKWHLFGEIAANNKAINAGYGKKTLEYYKKQTLTKYGFNQKLIANIEEKLKEGGENK